MLGSLAFLWRYRRIIPPMKNLLDTIRESTTDGKITREEQGKLQAQFWAIVDTLKQ